MTDQRQSPHSITNADNPDLLRRRDDHMISSLDKRLALVEQSQEMEHKAAEARWRSLEAGLAALTTETRQVNSTLQLVVSDPAASPAGRQLLAATSDNRRDIDEHERILDGLADFRAEIRGGMKLLRGVVAVSAALSSVAAVIQVLHLSIHL